MNYRVSHTQCSDSCCGNDNTNFLEVYTKKHICCAFIDVEWLRDNWKSSCGALKYGVTTCITTRCSNKTKFCDFPVQLLSNIQNGSGAQPASQSEVKWPGCEVYHSLLCSAKVKNEWRYNATPPARLDGVDRAFTRLSVTRHPQQAAIISLHSINRLVFVIYSVKQKPNFCLKHNDTFSIWWLVMDVACCTVSSAKLYTYEKECNRRLV